jgi:hypothetical protein
MVPAEACEVIDETPQQRIKAVVRWWQVQTTEAMIATELGVGEVEQSHGMFSMHHQAPLLYAI